MKLFEDINIQDQLANWKNDIRTKEDQVLSEAHKILHSDLFSEKRVLENLQQYNKVYEVLEEELLDPERIFSVSEIKEIAVRYRLKFLDTNLYKNEIPYKAIIKLKELNTRYYKELRYFKILAPNEAFDKEGNIAEALLFIKTNYDNYYLLESWGEKLNWTRKWKHWPMRNFETLALTLLFITLCITLSLPTAFITLDAQAVYWSGYRAAAFFHILIFNFGVTAYVTFAFAKNFSSTVWNRYRDFE